MNDNEAIADVLAWLNRCAEDAKTRGFVQTEEVFRTVHDRIERAQPKPAGVVPMPEFRKVMIEVPAQTAASEPATVWLDGMLAPDVLRYGDAREAVGRALSQQQPVVWRDELLRMAGVVGQAMDEVKDPAAYGKLDELILDLLELAADNAEASDGRTVRREPAAVEVTDAMVERGAIGLFNRRLAEVGGVHTGSRWEDVSDKLRGAFRAEVRVALTAALQEPQE